METVVTSLKEIWSTLSKRTCVIGGVLVSIVFISLILVAIFSGPDYQPLYSNLSLTDAAAITKILAENGTPYTLSDNGSTILVPKEYVYESRIALAAEGLPSGGVVGFETFNTTRLGETEADRQLRYRIALEGELTRTIRSLQEVEDARVHLVIAPKSLFIQDAQPSTASVLLSLKPGATLTKQQIKGITHLLATSVERLSPENITIVDTYGNVLNDISTDSNLDSTAIGQRLELITTYEKQLANNIRAMLERVYGYGKVVCLVKVDMDFDSKEQYEEIYSAPSRDGGLIRSQQSYLEFYLDQSSTGIPGVESNVPGYVQVNPQNNSSVSKQESTINYELNRTERHQVTPPGQITNLSVSIWIDGELSQKEIETIQSSVAGALGMKLDRGDYIAVAAVPFKADQTASSTTQLALAAQNNNYLWVYLVIAGLLLIFIVLLLFRVITQRSRTKLAAEVELAAAGELNEVEKTPEPESKYPSSDTLQHLKRYADERPKEFAQMIKGWLLED